MKKSLLALAALTAFAGAASAQSSVTLFGVVDLNLRSVDNSGGEVKHMGNDGLASSRLGFRGVEDLGGGMKASFWLEAGLDAGVGQAGGGNSCTAGGTLTGYACPTTGPSILFNRRSTVSLDTNWGELRAGRDLTPSFMNKTVFDPFGTNGLGSSLNIHDTTTGTGTLAAGTVVRANNMVQYFLPATLGGLYGTFGIAAVEGNRANDYWALRVGYRAGPFDVAYGYGNTDLGSPIGEFEDWNIAGSWTFGGGAKLMGQYQSYEITGRDQKIWLIGGSIPWGQWDFRASYSAAEGGGTAKGNDGDQFAIGFIYNLSKRTALYGTYSMIGNDGGARYTVTGNIGGITGATQAAGGDSSGYEFGIRHSF